MDAGIELILKPLDFKLFNLKSVMKTYKILVDIDDVTGAF